MSEYTSDDHSVFHEGERRIQTRHGSAERTQQIGLRAIRSWMPDQHREFFENLPMLLIGAVDDTGHPWATAAFGTPGFLRSPDPEHLDINGDVLLGEELSLELHSGSKLGLLGLELQTRRRNRMNGTVAETGAGRLSVRVDQSFGNCPQYIQRRDVAWRGEDSATGRFQRDASLSDRSRAIIQNTDTFFIASRSAALGSSRRDGIDVSHRGGKPGFVRISDGDRLEFPDFSGNRFFNTLGNIAVDDRVGLLFPDFGSGDAVFLRGTAQIVWDEERVGKFQGAERIIGITPQDSVLGEGIIRLKGTFIDQWPRLAETGSWPE